MQLLLRFDDLILENPYILAIQFWENQYLLVPLAASYMMFFYIEMSPSWYLDSNDLTSKRTFCEQRGYFNFLFI